MKLTRNPTNKLTSCAARRDVRLDSERDAAEERLDSDRLSETSLFEIEERRESVICSATKDDFLETTCSATKDDFLETCFTSRVSCGTGNI